MQHAVADFLRPSLVPELGSDVTAGTACHRHLVLVTVAAVRALPDQLTCLILDDFDLTVVAATLAVIALGIQLCIHDVIIDELHDRQDCRDILLHVRYFHVTDRTARRQLLELRFGYQFFKSINILCNVYMIAVCDLVFVCYTRDQSKTFLQTFCKFVSGGLKRCAIQTEVYVVL